MTQLKQIIGGGLGFLALFLTLVIWLMSGGYDQITNSSSSTTNSEAAAAACPAGGLTVKGARRMLGEVEPHGGELS